MKLLPLLLSTLLLLSSCITTPAPGENDGITMPVPPEHEISEITPEPIPEPEPVPESQPEPAPEPEPQPEPTPEPAPQPQPAPSAPAGEPPAYLGVGSPRVGDGGEYLSEVELDVLDGINAQRRKAGVPEVKWDNNLGDAARIRAAELYSYGYTAHTRPNGDRWSTVLTQDVPVDYAAAGEILASIKTQQNGYKISSADYWVNQWVGSSAHYNCMVNGNYTHAGVAVVYVECPDDGLMHGIACTVFARW